MQRLELRSASPALLGASDDFGLGATLRQARAEIEEAEVLLARYRSSHVPDSGLPFELDSQRLCIATYTAALGQVRERFWATTFLSSGFWSTDDAGILDANLRMTAALSRDGVVPRRLFLLHTSAEAEVQRWRDERMLLRKFDDGDGLARFDARLASLRRNLADLIAHGCDVRALYDERALYEGLPPELAFDPHDSELALYDDWRFDVFRGGRSGTIASVQCFTPVLERFAAYRDRVSRYFAALWDRAQPITALLERIAKAVEECSTRIDYQPIWLARYDHGLPDEDRLLKVVELSCVKAELQRLDRWGRCRRYLDVGTCTGRYPLSLRGAVRADGEIVGIDNDVDCVRFARWKVRQECPDDLRIRIEREDFCAAESTLRGPFDLVTCMLGTLLHFGQDRAGEAPYRDTLQHAIEKLAGLLARRGLLFFSVWSEEACAARRLLSIYAAEDLERLVRWAPPRDELQDRLRAAGLEFAPPLPLEGRMDLYRCRRPQRALRSPVLHSTPMTVNTEGEKHAQRTRP